MDPMFGNTRRASCAWLFAAVAAAGASGCSVDVAGTGRQASMEPAISADASALGSVVGENADASPSAPIDAERPPIAPEDAGVDSAEDANMSDDASMIVDANMPDAAHHGDGDASTGQCDFTGTYSVDLLFDVTWNNTTLAGIVQLLKAGKGQIHITLRVALSGPASAMNARLGVCGVQLPDFAASNALIGTEDYSAYFPDVAWDSTNMPHTDFGARFGCSAPGCALSLERAIATFGARTDPGDVWPGRNGDTSLITPVDHDGDGYPAMSLYSHGSEAHNSAGTAYEHIPVTWTLGARTTYAAIPFRVVADAIGKVDSCDALSGAISAGSLEARALACRAITSASAKETDCTADQVTFLDQNLPDWTVVGGSFHAKRIPADADCTAARTAWK